MEILLIDGVVDGVADFACAQCEQACREHRGTALKHLGILRKPYRTSKNNTPPPLTFHKTPCNTNESNPAALLENS